MKRILTTLIILTIFLPSGVFADPLIIEQSKSVANTGMSALADAHRQYPGKSKWTPICQYVPSPGGGTDELILQIDKTHLDNRSILMGLDRPEFCPVPGKDSLPPGYNSAIMSEFLFSGVICVTQTIILDAMFSVYCTILLWFYNILYAALIIYVMFYGLAIMLELTDEPIREAPARIFKTLFIFLFAVNAEIGFKFIHTSFNAVLVTFSDILTEIQPIYTESGEIAYKRDDKGDLRLLDTNGNFWKPPEWEKYCTPADNLDEDGNPKPCGPLTQNGSLGPNDVVKNYEYVQFRIPAQQWSLEPIDPTKRSSDFHIVPVFKQVSTNENIKDDYDYDGYHACNQDCIDNFVDPISHQTCTDACYSAAFNFVACVADWRWDAGTQTLQPELRCHDQGWNIIPDVAPLGGYGTKNLSTNQKRTFYTKDNNSVHNFPIYLLNEPPNLKEIICDDSNPPKTYAEPGNIDLCRKPFQGILNRVDAMFNSVVGSENARGFSMLIVAVALWGVGGGGLLAMFLMTGYVSMFTAFVNILWTYTTSMMGLTFMMMLSPIFISFALFKFTEKLFRAWVANLISFCLQPIFVLGFLYVLSNATTLDKLTELAKKEVSEITYYQNVEGSKPIEFDAPGFTRPLYKVPNPTPKGIEKDDLTPLQEATCPEAWDGKYYCDCAPDDTEQIKYCPPESKALPFAKLDEGSDQATSSGAAGIQDDRSAAYFSMRQRNDWRNNVMRQMIVNFKVCLYEKNEKSSSDKFKECLVNWDKGEVMNMETIDANSATGAYALDSETSKDNKDQQIPAIKAYFTPPIDDVSGTKIPCDPPASIPTEKTPACVVNKLNNLINQGYVDATTNETYKGIIGVKKYVEAGGLPAEEQDIFMDLVEAYHRVIGFEDDDAFDGEPRNGVFTGGTAFDTGQPNGEFPPCLKNCPKFNPAYKADATTPSAPDPTAPTRNPQAGTCTEFCMYIYDDEKSRYAYLVGAILVWIVINVMSGAFVSKIPELAKHLSNWQGYANVMPAIAGGSMSMSGVTSNTGGELIDEGEDAFSLSEKAGVFTMGGLFGTGVFNKTPGLFAKAASRTVQEFQGREKIVKQDEKTGDYYVTEGRYKDPYYKAIWESNGIVGYLLGGKDRADQKERLKNQMVVLGEGTGKSTGNLMDYAMEKANAIAGSKLTPKEKGEIFNKLTGMVSDNNGRPPADIKTTIENLVESILKARESK